MIYDEFKGPHQLKVPVCRRGAYEITLEQWGRHTFIHADVLGKWTPNVKRRFAADIESLIELHGGPLLMWAYETNNKLLRFATLFGFKPVAQLPGGVTVMEKKKQINNGRTIRRRVKNTDHE